LEPLQVPTLARGAGQRSQTIRALEGDGEYQGPTRRLRGDGDRDRDAVRVRDHSETARALEHLFDAELAYKEGMDAVVPQADREGTLIGSGDGVVRGAKIRGRMRWSFYSAACLYPAARARFAVPKGQHLCKVNPGGVIETEDGARVFFDAKGYGLRGYDPQQPSRYVLTMSLRFATDDARYAWLNSVLGLWEGRFDEASGRATYTAYVTER
jgi:hypothetical protein